MSRATAGAVSAACSFQLLPLPVKVSLAQLTGPSGFLVSCQSYPCPGPCSQCQPPPVQLHWLDAMSSGALIKCSVFCARFAHSGGRMAILIIRVANYIFAVCVTRMQREWLFWSQLQITLFSLLMWHFGAKRMALSITRQITLFSLFVWLHEMKSIGGEFSDTFCRLHMTWLLVTCTCSGVTIINHVLSVSTVANLSSLSFRNVLPDWRWDDHYPFV